MWRVDWAVLCSLLLGVACHAADSGDWYVEKHLSIAAASRLEGSDKLTSQVNKLRLKTEYQGKSFEFNFDGQLQYDAVYDWHDAYSEEAEDDYGSRLWLDQAYITGAWRNMDLSFGYQKVVWGEADDLRVVDIVNSLDLKDFVLFDIDDYRISVPMLRLETSSDNWDIQALLIPFSKTHELPASGSEFSIPALEYLPEDKRDKPEIGLRAQTFLLGSDLSFYAFRGYNDMPVLSVRPRNNSATPMLSLRYAPETMLGSSLSRPFGDWVVRGEIAYFQDREYSSLDLSEAKSHTVQYLLGLDYLYRNWLFTGQFTDHYIKSWNNTYLVEAHEPIYTFSADATLASATMALRLAVSHADYAGGGQLLQTKFSYLPNKQWAFRLHVDILAGDTNNFFGQYKENDRVWLSVDYTF